jgi:hypothetical protein
LVGLVALELDTSRDVLEESVVHTHVANVTYVCMDHGFLKDIAIDVIKSVVIEIEFLLRHHCVSLPLSRRKLNLLGD